MRHAPTSPEMQAMCLPHVSVAREPSHRCRADRGRGQIALPFPPVPLQTVLATFMAHGSLVPLFPRLWPIEVDVHVTPPAERDALTFACTHALHPERFLPASLFVQVGQMAYVVHFHVLLASTYVAGIFEEPFDFFQPPAYIWPQ